MKLLQNCTIWFSCSQIITKKNYAISEFLYNECVTMYTVLKIGNFQKLPRK